MNDNLRNDTLNNIMSKSYINVDEYDTSISKLKAVIKQYKSESYSLIANELKIEPFRQNDFRSFLEESLATSVSKRLNINYTPNK